MLVPDERIEQLVQIFDDRESQYKVRNILRLVRNEYEERIRELEDYQSRVRGTMDLYRGGEISAADVPIHLDWIG